jgi:proline iminopeptidase
MQSLSPAGVQSPPVPDPEPHEIHEISVGTHRVTAYSYGQGEDVLLCLNGGPGLPCDYLRAPHAGIAEHGFRVVIHDQLGTGRSDNPQDPSLWTLERYVEEVECVRQTLGLGKVHLLGHSWGGWLGIEYALEHGDALKSLILANTCADMPHLRGEIDRLRAELGPDTVAVLQAAEAEETYDQVTYNGAIRLLDGMHIRRLSERPEPVRRSQKGFNRAIYQHVQGPNEYHYSGTIKDWNRVPDLHRIGVPVLVLGGQFDVMTPHCAMRTHRALPQAEIKIFKNSSHSPFYEEPAAYLETVIDFLIRHRRSDRED